MGSYNLSENVMRATKRSSPGWGMGSSKRVFYTEMMAKAKKMVPSPGTYDSNVNGIHRRLVTKRH